MAAPHESSELTGRSYPRVRVPADGYPDPPTLVGLCPGDHLGEFYMPMEPGETSEVCPMCSERMVVYAPVAGDG